MEKTKERKLHTLWRICPARHALLAISLLWLGFYFLFRENKPLMNVICRIAVRPWHRFAGKVYSILPFSAAEWLIAVGLLAAALFFVQLGIHVVGRRGGEALYRWAVSLVTILAVLFGLFSLWWGVFYYSDTFAEQAGISRRDISVGELRDVTAYFASLANGYKDRVDRDEDGCFAVPKEDILAQSETIYAAAERVYPCLAGPPLRAKGVYFSRVMSRINYTGFFFPFTAEANVNMDSPGALLPSTVAHELAHQRGVAGEDEANFVAVLASLESGNDAYIYSSALLAYIYLGNALYRADAEAWRLIAWSIDPLVWNDLDANSAYWKQFEGKAAEISEKVYEGYLKTYGDDRGMKSYGACVDLLTVCYLDEARTGE